MEALRYLALALAVVFHTGCVAVESKSYVGTQRPIQEEKWKGDWQGYPFGKAAGLFTYRVEVVDATKGTVKFKRIAPKVAPPDVEDIRALVAMLEEGEVKITDLRGVTVANYGPKGAWLFAGIAKSDEALLVCLPSHGRMTRLIKNGVLQGNVPTDPRPVENIKIDGIPDTAWEGIAKEGWDATALFESHPALVFIPAPPEPAK